ncbi:MAG: FAD:protein FMN transferase [Desulfobacteraceae bacterium]|jgi:thiamine biosynthesis lipoprotein
MMCDVSVKRTMGYVFSLALAMITIACGCNGNEPVTFTGRTMGTVYHITVIAEDPGTLSALPEKIEDRLESINASMSVFDNGSELSRFNTRPKGDQFCVSDSFMKVFREGQNLYRMTGGAWDGTVATLVDLWGFGPQPRTHTLPDGAAIKKNLAVVGFSKIEVRDGHCLIKTVDGLELDFGSIAKGFAVDEIAELLMALNIHNYLVEIGGEVRAGGKKNGKLWKVGINTPRPDAPVDQVITAIELKDRSIATSGDYRNFRTDNGKNYSHEIDPGTGWPINNNVAGVSVIADTAMFADGLATALMVMGETKGLALVNTLDRVDCLFIVRDKNKGFRMIPSKGFLLK